MSAAKKTAPPAAVRTAPAVMPVFDIAKWEREDPLRRVIERLNIGKPGKFRLSEDDARRAFELERKIAVMVRTDLGEGARLRPLKPDTGFSSVQPNRYPYVFVNLRMTILVDFYPSREKLSGQVLEEIKRETGEFAQYIDGRLQ